MIVFLAISALLTRVLSLPAAERDAVTALLRSEARGDASGMARAIHLCRRSPACRQRAREDASALRRPGAVKILELGPSGGFSLGSTVGTARVAWRAGTTLPIVQCVKVRRAGDVLGGFHVELLEVSRRIKTDADCPARY